MADGADLGEPDCSDARGGPREMRIVSRLLDKFRYTAGCFYDHRQHSLACRTRIYELRKDDVDELDKME